MSSLLPSLSVNLNRWQKDTVPLKLNFAELIDELKKNPQTGTPIGPNCYKIRLAIASKGKGKSGGARVITCVFVKETAVYLLSIFDKSEKENISDAELKRLLQGVNK